MSSYGQTLLALLLAASSLSLACERPTKPDSRAVSQTTSARSQPHRPAAPPPEGPAALPSPPPHGAGRSLGLRGAKRALRELYRKGEHRSLYADCPFDNWRLDWSRCCYEPPDNPRKRLEWEHVVPAAHFGNTLSAWKEGAPQCRDRRGRYKGRRCARRVSRSFRAMEADMHNLFPAIGDINERRAHYPMAIIAGEARRFGRCDVEIARERIEPRPQARGEIARAYLYMQWRYPKQSRLSEEERKLMLSWHASDPPDDFERARDRFISERQGIANPWMR